MFHKRILSLCIMLGILGLTGGQAKALNHETEILKDNFSLKFNLLEEVKEGSSDEILNVRFDRKDTETTSSLSVYSKNNSDYNILVGLRDNKSLIGLKYYLEMVLIENRLHVNKDYKQELKALLRRKNLPEQEQYVIYDGEFYNGIMKLKELLQPDANVTLDKLVDILKFFDSRIKNENKDIEYQAYVGGGYEAFKINFNGDTLYLRYKSNSLDNIFKDLEKVLEKQWNK